MYLPWLFIDEVVLNAYSFPWYDVSGQVDLALNNNDNNSYLLTCHTIFGSDWACMSNVVAGNVTNVSMTIDGETAVSPFQFKEGQREVQCTGLNFNPASAEVEMKLYLAGKVQKELRTTDVERDVELSTAVRANRYRLL